MPFSLIAIAYRATQSSSGGSNSNRSLRVRALDLVIAFLPSTACAVLLNFLLLGGLVSLSVVSISFSLVLYKSFTGCSVKDIVLETHWPTLQVVRAVDGLLFLVFLAEVVAKAVVIRKMQAGNTPDAVTPSLSPDDSLGNPRRTYFANSWLRFEIFCFVVRYRRLLCQARFQHAVLSRVCLCVAKLYSAWESPFYAGHQSHRRHSIGWERFVLPALCAFSPALAVRSDRYPLAICIETLGYDV